MHIRLLVVALALASALPVAASPGGPALGVEIADPAVKVLNGPDDDGDLFVSISVRVKNTTDRELAVEIIVQGLTRGGAEVYDLYLNEALTPAQERVFTDTDYIKEAIFKSVVTWRVEEAIIRGGQPNNAQQGAHSRVAPADEEAQAARR